MGTYSIATGTASSTSVNNNFGELLPGTIEGVVYVDANNNGLFSAETLLPNVPISLTGIDDQGNSVTANATTSAAGAFSFANLRPGTYSVSETTQPAAYVDGLDTRGNSVPLVGSAGGNDTINSITVLSGQTASGNNFGEVPPSTIQGRVFADGNNDGLANNGDNGLAGITVTLSGTDVFGNPVTDTTSTDTNGNYSFDFLLAGNYVVTEPTQPASYFDGFESRSNVVLPGTIGSDVITGIVLGVGQTSSGNNFAEVPDVMPQGFAYIDANNNGVKDPGEPGLSGVQINLTGVGNDIFGNPIPSRTEFTDGQGFYQFTSIPPGTYTITEVQPAGFQDGQEQNGTPAAASVINDSFVAIPLINTTSGGDYNFGELSPSGSVSVLLM
ncbi:MAG: SdrD B-like domain-containing protein [Pirellulaceae bacterium]